MKYKCYNCSCIVDKKPCPVCGDRFVEEMCELDHTHCSHDIVSGIMSCPVCGKPCCPTCQCHDVIQISRVTGYLSDIGGWNNAKKQELKDRKRYDLLY
jgi:hypothetical protein